MNTIYRQSRKAGLSGLKVLAMLPTGGEDRADYLVQLVTTMKSRCGWQINIICPPHDEDAFTPLAEPSGRIFSTLDYRQPGDWETDPAAAAQVVARLEEAERLSGVPVGQLLLASPGSIGCAFMLPNLILKPSALFDRVLADNSEPGRLYRRMFAFAEQVVEVAKPDLLLAYEWEKPWRSSVWMAATRRKIPCVVIRRSKLNGDHYFWTTDRTFFNLAAHALAQTKRDMNAPVSDEARKKIEDFRRRPETVKYIKEKWELQSRKSRLKWHANWARDVAKQGVAMLTGRGKSQVSLLNQLVEYNRKIVQGRRDQRFFASLDAATLASMKYLYFPMHKETDLPLVFQAPRWFDQRNTIQVLAGAVPAGYRLLCREHRFNVGRRPKHYYEQLAKLPNVTLIDPFGSQFDYIRYAALLVTENGSSGWEGLLFKRPVITLSRTVYDGAGLAHKLADPDKIGATVLQAVAGPAVPDQDEYERRLGWMLDAEIETTFSMKLDRVAEGADRLEDLLSPLFESDIRPHAAARTV